jgi:hypothetical protein
MFHINEILITFYLHMVLMNYCIVGYFEDVLVTDDIFPQGVHVCGFLKIQRVRLITSSIGEIILPNFHNCFFVIYTNVHESCR